MNYVKCTSVVISVFRKQQGSGIHLKKMKNRHCLHIQVVVIELKHIGETK